MIILPSGRIAGITNERSRFHATRRKIRVTRDSPLRQLYKLVDVICFNSQDREDGNNHRYAFTGLTIADLHDHAGWNANDKECFFTWINQDLQVNKILGAKRMLIYDDLPSKIQVHDYPRRLYSHLRQCMHAINMSYAPPAQWLRTLQNLATRGVQRDELTWCGVTEFLQSQAQKTDRLVSKEEILAHMDFNALHIELTNELTPSQESTLTFDEVADIIPLAQLSECGVNIPPSSIAVCRYINRFLNYRIGLVKFKAPVEHFNCASAWFALDPYGKALRGQDDEMFFNSAQQAINAANLHAKNVFAYQGPLGFSNKYQYVSLSGGEDYREWLVTLPDYHESHFASHFTERNVLVHIRTKTRIDNKKRKLLFIEEIQSDWHKAASSKINANHWDRQIPHAPFRKEWWGLAIKLMLLHAVDNGFDGIAWSDGRIQESHYHRQMPGIRRLYDKYLPQYVASLARPWDAQIASTEISTREPWLRAKRVKDKWQVSDASGKFCTRSNHTKSSAIKIIETHSKEAVLTVPMFLIPEAMRQHISLHGLPLFGHSMPSK